MKIIELKYNNNIIKKPHDISDILFKEKLFWLIDAEIEDAEIEIKNSTLIWHNGIFFAGNWQYGIWKDGVFHGIWENGIWEGGEFHGKWMSGIKM